VRPVGGARSPEVDCDGGHYPAPDEHGQVQDRPPHRVAQLASIAFGCLARDLVDACPGEALFDELPGGDIDDLFDRLFARFGVAAARGFSRSSNGSSPPSTLARGTVRRAARPLPHRSPAVSGS